MKKFLAVATALVLAISSLCVFVVADTTETTVTVTFDEVTLGGYGYTSSVDANGALTIDYNSQYAELKLSLPSSVTGTVTSVTFNVSSGNTSYLCLKIYEGSSASTTKYHVASVSGVEYDASSISLGLMHNNDDDSTAVDSFVIDSITVTVVEDTSSGTEGNETVTIDGVTYDVVYDVPLDSLTGWSTIITVTDEVYGYLTTSGAIIEVDFSAGSWFWGALWVQQTSGSWDQENVTGNSDGYWNQSFSSTLDIAVADTTLTSSSCLVSGESQIILNMGDNIVASNVKILVPSGTGTKTETETETYTMSGLIYVNDEYHAIKLNGHFIVLAHTDDNGDGVCDLCHQAFSADEEESSDIVMEDVEVEQPAEDTDTETEEDGEDIDVGDTGSDAEETTDSNPTTGVVLALVPMAIAGFAVVSSKRR